MKYAIVGWIICGVLAYGLTFGYFQREYPYVAEKNRALYISFSLFVAAAGPIGLGVAIVKSDFAKHGLKYRFKEKSKSMGNLTETYWLERLRQHDLSHQFVSDLKGDEND